MIPERLRAGTEVSDTPVIAFLNPNDATTRPPNMKAVSEFVANLNEVFVLFGQIEAKRMFGGYGIYHDRLMFALVVDDVLYLKADKTSAPSFDQLGLPRFEYEKSGKKMSMSYYAAPEDIFDEPEQAKEWAVRAYDAALRANTAKIVSGGKKRKAE